jgi:hypothetical protein
MGRYGVMHGMWKAPVTAHVMIRFSGRNIVCRLLPKDQRRCFVRGSMSLRASRGQCIIGRAKRSVVAI